MPPEPTPREEERIVRRDPAPLVMKKGRDAKEDGRALIYYEFVAADLSAGLTSHGGS